MILIIDFPDSIDIASDQEFKKPEALKVLVSLIGAEKISSDTAASLLTALGDLAVRRRPAAEPRPSAGSQRRPASGGLNFKPPFPIPQPEPSPPKPFPLPSPRFGR